MAIASSFESSPGAVAGGAGGAASGAGAGAGAGAGGAVAGAFAFAAFALAAASCAAARSAAPCGSLAPLCVAQERHLNAGVNCRAALRPHADCRPSALALRTMPRLCANSRATFFGGGEGVVCNFLRNSRRFLSLYYIIDRLYYILYLGGFCIS